MLEKSEHEAMMKVLSDQDAAKLKERQEQVEAVNRQTLDLLERSEKILPEIEYSATNTNEDLLQSPSIRPSLRANLLPKTSTRSISMSPVEPNAPNTPEFKTKRAKQTTTTDILQELLVNDKTTDVVSAKDESIKIASSYASMLTEAHEKHRQDLLQVLSSQKESHDKLLSVLDKVMNK